MEIFRGTVLRYKGGGFEMIKDGIVAVEHGKIEFVEDARKMKSDKNGDVKFKGQLLKRSQLAILPPCANMHDHSFQPPGIPGELIYFDKKAGRLCGWLPTTLKEGELKAKTNHEAAGEMIRYKLKKFAENGIGTVLQYTTSSVETVSIVLEEGAKSGLRVIAGYVCMDQGIEDIRRGLQTSGEDAVRSTEFLLRMYGADKVAVIDRFPIAVSSDTRKKLAKLALKYGALYETHMDESVSEKNIHKSIYGTKSIARTLLNDGVFAGKGRVGLAHSIHTNASEMDLIHEKIGEGCKVFIRACPNSNGQLASHFKGDKYVEFPLQKWQSAGATITFGTDQGAGRGWNIFGEMLDERKRHPVARQPSCTELLKCGTLNGHVSAGVDVKKTNIVPGNKAEFLVVKMAGASGFYDEDDLPDNLEEAAARVIEGAAFDEYILHFYLEGKRIY